MRRFDTELAVGLFLLAGIGCLGYLSIRLARLEMGLGGGYEVRALFGNSGGLKTGAAVTIAGVEVGRVRTIQLEDYRAEVVLALAPGIEVQEDAIASIKTKGLIGEKFVEITPGGSEELVGPGGRIRETEGALDFGDLLRKFVHGKVE